MEKTPTHREKKSLQDIMKEHTKKNKQRKENKKGQTRTNKNKQKQTKGLFTHPISSRHFALS